MKDIAIVSAVRTPVGRAIKGNLRDTRPDDMAGLVVKNAVERVDGLDPAMVDDVIMGCAMPEAEQGMNVGRIAAFRAGLPHDVPGVTINRFCSSGLQAMAWGASQIAAGWNQIVVAGGVESMSMVPMGGNKPSANPTLMENAPAVYTSMGITAENVAQKYEVTRADQDAFALSSHEKALAAQAEGLFDSEIVPVETQVFTEAGGMKVTVSKDEGPRAGSTLEALGKLRPVFSAKGSVTAGNSSPMNDGAAATVLMTAEMAADLGAAPQAYFRNFAVAGVPPEIMGVGPAYAIPKLLEQAGLKIDDIDIFEINEAFAAQAIYCQRKLEIDPAKLNVKGGAIALGHPLGCTGARIAATLLPEMERRNARYGVISMCIGGGMGAAALIERPGA